MPRKSGPRRRTTAKTPRRQPETLRLAGVTPSLTVDNLARSLAWYRDVLGFHLKDQWDDDGVLSGVELQAGTVTFILNQDDFAKGRDRRKGEGFRLYCRTRQDIDRLAANIKAAGGVLAQEPTDRPWGSRDFALADPDGIKISITTIAG